MKNSVCRFLVGVLLAAAPLAAAGDREERYKAKMGRYTQAEESRRSVVKQQPETMECAGCCHRTATAPADAVEVAAAPAARVVARAKWGRALAGEETAAAPREATDGLTGDMRHRPACCD